MKIHPLADVQSPHIGPDTTVWQYAVILKGAVIGSGCNINCHTFIENDVTLGDRVTVKPGVFLWDGMEIGNGVFIGPNATFTNDKYPRSKQYPESFQKTRLEDACSIGANATILGSVTIGHHAIVGAGSVVTKDVPPHALVVGSPARIVAWVDEKGQKLLSGTAGQLNDAAGNRYQITDQKLSKI